MHDPNKKLHHFRIQKDVKSLSDEFLFSLSKVFIIFFFDYFRNLISFFSLYSYFNAKLLLLKRFLIIPSSAFSEFGPFELL